MTSIPTTLPTPTPAGVGVGTIPSFQVGKVPDGTPKTEVLEKTDGKGRARCQFVVSRGETKGQQCDRAAYYDADTKCKTHAKDKTKSSKEAAPPTPARAPFDVAIGVQPPRLKAAPKPKAKEPTVDIPLAGPAQADEEQPELDEEELAALMQFEAEEKMYEHRIDHYYASYKELEELQPRALRGEETAKEWFEKMLKAQQVQSNAIFVRDTWKFVSEGVERVSGHVFKVPMWGFAAANTTPEILQWARESADSFGILENMPPYYKLGFTLARNIVTIALMNQALLKKIMEDQSIQGTRTKAEALEYLEKLCAAAPLFAQKAGPAAPPGGRLPPSQS